MQKLQNRRQKIYNKRNPEIDKLVIEERKRVFEARGKDEVLLPDIIKIERYNQVAGPTGLVITDEGCVVYDTGYPTEGADRVKKIRTFTDKPFHTIVFSHGHRDHSGGVGAFLADAAQRGHPKPRIIAHENVIKRFDKYQMLRGRRAYISALQFPDMPTTPRKDDPELGLDFNYPDTIITDRLSFWLGGLNFEIYHALAETDDALWLWIPERKVAMIGDIIIGSCPNTGNPLKEQRFTLDWAEALERIAKKKPEYIFAGPGVLRGEAGQHVLLRTAKFLRFINNEVVRLLNEKYWIEDILDKITFPEEVLQDPWLVGTYGHPAFVIHDVYRRYTGWYDGNPSELFPLKSSIVMNELLKFVAPETLLAHARQLKKENKIQLALHIIDYVVQGTCNEKLLKATKLLKADLLEARGNEVPNFIARNIMRTSATILREEAKQIDN